MELPRSVGLAEVAAGAFEGAWPREGVREGRGMWHGYRVRLDCADYFQRLTWILRRYPDVPTQHLLWRVLRPGDTVIDGGANIGLVSLFAAWRVGAMGCVHAFEPNPAAAERLRWHVAANGLSQVMVHEAGLSDAEGEAELVVPGSDNLGAGTFAAIPDRYGGSVLARAAARLARADDLGLEIRGRLVVKLDVEGYEVRALRGMASLLEAHRPLILTEVNPEMLAQAGASAGELAEFLMSRGYEPFGYSTQRAIVRERRLVLRRMAVDDLPVDVAWVQPHGWHEPRLWSVVAAD